MAQPIDGRLSGATFSNNNSDNEQGLSAFAFEGQPVRIEVIDGEPWWVVRDLGVVLGYAESSNANKLAAVVPEDWKGRKRIPTPGGVQEILCLSEQGLYFFLARSDKPAALPFQKWIAGEVLPRIRRTGRYAVVERPKTQVELLLASVQALADQERALEALRQDQALVVRRVDAIEARAIEAEQAFFALQAPTVEVPVLTVRSQINQLVRQHCVLCGVDYNKAWDALYVAFRYRCHIDLSKRADNLNAGRPLNPKGKPVGKELHELDIAEMLERGDRPGTMAQLHAIAFEMFGPKAPRIPTKRDKE